MEPEVVDIKNVTIEWNTPPDESGLIAFLVKEKGFSEERVRNGLEALKKARCTKPQGRLDAFFKPHPKTTPTPQSHASSASAATSKKGLGTSGIDLPFRPDRLGTRNRVCKCVVPRPPGLLMNTFVEYYRTWLLVLPICLSVQIGTYI